MHGTINDRIVTRSRPVHGSVDHWPIVLVRVGAGHIAAHKQQGCGQEHCEEGRRLHGHCQLLSVLPNRGGLASSRSRVTTYRRWLVSAIGIPSMRRMGSSGPTVQPSVDRRVRRVQRSISGNEAIVTDVTTSGSQEAEHDHLHAHKGCLRVRRGGTRDLGSISGELQHATTTSQSILCISLQPTFLTRLKRV